MLEIAAAHGIPYAASASIAYLEDLKKKVARARQATAAGPAYLHIHTPCPTGWAYDPALTIEIAKAAVQTGAWVLMEIQNGDITLNRKLDKLKPIGSYLKLQGRFKHISQTDIESIQQDIDHYINKLNEITAKKE